MFMSRRFAIASFEKDSLVYKRQCHTVELLRYKGDGSECFQWRAIDLSSVHPPLVFDKDALMIGEDLVPDLVRDRSHLCEFDRKPQEMQN